MNDRVEYNRIGARYSQVRSPDARLADAIRRELGAARTVVNVGAGTGSYEPTDRDVVALDPSVVMLRQRASDAAPAVLGRAEALPFSDRSFDAAMAVLTVHHWTDQAAGMKELARVARDRVVIMTWDPASAGFWLMREYFPTFLEQDRQRLPAIDRLLACLTDADVFPLPIPHDCTDGFLGAYWRRPHAYLDSAVRSGISSFATCDDLSPLERLKRDLMAGEWQRRHADLISRDALDVGYRLVVGRPWRG